MKKHILILTLLTLPSIALAALQPDDFAYEMPISIKENGAIYRLHLPLAVYQSVTRPDLGDLRVFNHADHCVPHILQRPQKSERTPPSVQGLPFFPLYRKPDAMAKDGLSINIIKDASGAVINVESDDRSAKDEKQPAGYLIDASHYKGYANELAVDWTDTEANFLTAVSVEYSNDLTSWFSLVNRATLARMQYGSHEIIQKNIPLPGSMFRYLRLVWEPGSERLELNKISVMQHGTRSEPAITWTSVTGTMVKPRADEKRSGIEFDCGARLPVSGIRLNLSQKNSLIEARILSRNDPKEKWRLQQTGIFYHLVMDQASLVQTSLSIQQTADRFWRVEIDGGGTSDQQKISKMELGWTPHELLFVAQGKGPFSLAYGSARIKTEDLQNNFSSLFNQLIHKPDGLPIKEASLLAPAPSGGPDRLIPEPPPLPWKKWLLWGILIGGVGLIAWMAVSLSRSMQKET